VSIRAFRVVKARHAPDAFTGEGARLFGGRWNSPGVPVIYTASSISLALLELLVHLHARSRLQDYGLFPVDFDEALVTTLDRSALPRDWRAAPAPIDVQRIGDAWAASRESAVLRVPSAVVEQEDNYLLNPNHPQFNQIAIGKQQTIELDPRLP